MTALLILETGDRFCGLTEHMLVNLQSLEIRKDDNMRRKMICSSAIALTLLMSSIGYAQIPLQIEINFRSSANATGSLLDDTGLLDLPLNNVPVLEDERVGDQQLTISVPTFSGLDNPTLNGSASAALGFGINSGGFDDGFTAFDSDFMESVVISFSQDLFIEAIDLQSLDGFGGANDVFRVGDVLINDSQTGASDVFSFINAANPDGLFLEAGQTLLLEATDGAVALQTLTVQVSAIPEPSSMLGLMGLAGLFVLKRRR